MIAIVARKGTKNIPCFVLHTTKNIVQLGNIRTIEHIYSDTEHSARTLLHYFCKEIRNISNSYNYGKSKQQILGQYAAD